MIYNVKLNQLTNLRANIWWAWRCTEREKYRTWCHLLEQC